MTGKQKNNSKNLRVLFVNRPDMFTVPGGDTTHMIRLKEGLEKLGVIVDISAELYPDPADYDIINVFNLLIPQHTLRQVLSLRADSLVPIILTPFYWDRSESLWGESAVTLAVEKAKNFKELDDLLSQIANGKLKSGKYSKTSNNRLYADYDVEQKTALQFVDHLIPISLKEQDLVVRKFEYPEQCCTTIMTGTDFPKKKASSDLFVKKYGIKDFILTTGRVETRKNQLMLLYALRDSKIPIVVSGGQPDKHYLELCKRVASPNALFVGRLDDEMLSSARAAARVHALPSWWECAGISHMEASLDGCNIVVGNKAAEPDYFGDGAYYCDPSNVNSIRTAVLSAYHNYEKDAERIEQLQKHIYANFGWDQIAKKHLEIYNMVCKKYFNVDANSLNQRKALPRIAQAYNYFLKGNLSATIKLLPTLFNSDTNHPLSYYLAGKTSILANLPEKAVEMFQQSLKYDPNNTLVMRNLSQALLASGKHKEALKMLEELLNLSPDDNETRWLLSRTLLAMGSWDKALETIEGKNILLFNEKSASIIILTYNSAKTISKCLQSVYENLRDIDEVIIVDNNSEDKTCSVIEKFIAGKKQFKLIRNQNNIGFSAGTNVGIKASKNSFVVLLNPDTIATKNWMERLIFHFNDSKIAAVGPVSNYVAGYQKMELYLKNIPQNAALNEIVKLIYNENKGKSADTKLLIGFCVAIRRNVIDELGLLDENLFLGNDDLELSWRLRINGYSLKVATDTFIYHEGQQSFNTKPKEFVNNLVQESTDALYLKLQEHYGANNVPTPKELWDINWFTPTNSKFNSSTKLFDKKSIHADEIIEQPILECETGKSVSIIILTYNGVEYTKQFYDSLIESTDLNYELIIIDNSSTDGTKEYIQSISLNNKNVKAIFNDDNLGFPVAVNQGIQTTQSKYILIANNDIILTKGWLKRLIQVAESDRRIGIVGPISNEVSGVQKDKEAKYKTIEEMHLYADSIKEKNKNKTFHFPRVAFLCTLIKRDVINNIGGLDERFSPGNYEDDDFCLRAQLAGYKTVIAQDVFIHHYGSKSFKAAGEKQYGKRLKTNREIFVNKWGADPDEIWLQKKPFNNYKTLFVSINQDEFVKRFERASKHLEDKEYNFALSELEFSLNQYDSSEKAVSIISKEDLLILSANVALILKDLEKAKSNFEEALRINPTSSESCFGLGQVFYQAELFEESKTMLEWAVKNNFKNAKAIDSLALVNELLSLPYNHNSLLEAEVTPVTIEN